MKKVLSVVLAVAMVLACVASLAFVLDNQTGITTATNSALDVEGIHVTDEAAMVTGVKVYSDLANNNDALYTKQQIIRLAVDLSIKNPNYDQSVKSADGNEATLIFESDTVDFSLNQQFPYTSMVLYKPYYVDGIVSTNLVNVVANTAQYQPVVSKDKGTMEVLVTYYTEHPGLVFDAKLVSSNDSGSRFDKDQGLILTGIADNPWTVKTDHTLVVTGVTKGDTTQEGRVTLSMEDKAGDSFQGDGVVKVEKNGHTYVIEKRYASNDSDTSKGAYTTKTLSNGEPNPLFDAKSVGELQWVGRMGIHDPYSTNPDLYDVDAVGYLVFVLLDDKGTADVTDDIYGLIGMFETEQVRKGAIYATPELNQRGEDTGLGISLGLSYYNGYTAGSFTGVDAQLLPFVGTEYVLHGAGTEVYKRSTPDYLWGFTFTRDDYTARKTLDGISTTLSGYMTARAALEQFMSDFGFGTGTGYNYKIQDSNFVSAATYDELGTATYNGNAIVIEQPDEGEDLEEGTGDEEIPDEGDIEEDIPDEGEVEEEPTPEPVPETGDASAAVAVALTAAALVAAAGLAVVLKKAR